MNNALHTAKTERKFQNALAELLEDTGNDTYVSTFEDVGMLTLNKGLVVRLENGAEFQVTIVQSCNAKN